MSIESFEALNAKLDLYSALDKGCADVQNGRKMPYSDFTAQLRKELKVSNGGIFKSTSLRRLSSDI